MILRSKKHSNKTKEQEPNGAATDLDELKYKSNNEEDNTSKCEGLNEKSELVDDSYLYDQQEKPLNCGSKSFSSASKKYGAADEHTRNSYEVPDCEKPPLYNRQYSSLDRGSSTTSGISSDGEWRYQEEPHHYLHHESPYR